MKAGLLWLSSLLFTLTGTAQTLSGKFVYSHHNRLISAKDDSIYSLDTTGKRRFITLGFDPKVSPSGTYMAFENGPSYDALRANIWMRNLSTKKDTQIVSNPNDYLNYFDFYSSEKQIVYAQSCNIYTSNINGSNAYTFLVCTPCDCYSDDPQIRFSDGEITYHNQHYGIYTCGSNGSNPQKLTKTVPGDMFPTWSPDGKKIAFLKTSLNNNIYKINVATGDTTRLTFFSSPDTIIFNPYFSENSKSVFFIARIKNKTGIYKVSANGSGAYSLVHALDGNGSVYDYFLGKSNTKSIATAFETNPANENMPAAEAERTAAMLVYPNPVYNKIVHLQLNNIIQGNYNIAIYNANGQTLYSQGFQYTGSTTSITINLKNAAAGMYKIEMKNNNNSYYTTVMLQ